VLERIVMDVGLPRSLIPEECITYVSWLLDML